MSLNRKQKIEELLESLRPIRRHMALSSVGRNAARVTPSQWGVLMLVGERGECTVKHVANGLHVSSSAATQLVTPLVKSGHLVRRELASDRRAVALSLSKRTKAKMNQMRNAALQKALSLFESLSDGELEQYIALNRKIAQAFAREQEM